MESNKQRYSKQIQQFAILDNIKSIVVYINKKLDIIWLNKAALSITSKKKKEIIGKKCYEFWGEKSICNNCAFSDVLKNKKSQNVRIVNKKKRIFDNVLEPVLDSSGKITGIVFIGNEVTDVVH